MNETTIIDAARSGNVDAFNELIHLHQDFLFRVALRIHGDEDSAADALQETMISAFRKLNTFRGGSLKHWLARIIVNVCYDELRHERRQRVIPLAKRSANDEEMEPGFWMADPKAGPEEICESHELDHAISICLQSLTLVYRTALVLVDIEDYSYEEAAEIMGIPVNTVKSRLARARMKMRKALKGFEDQLPGRYRDELFQKAQADVAYSA